MDEEHHYTVEITGNGSKTGMLGSSDPVPDLAVAAPIQFGGPGGMWSPEHLFIASVTACLMTTFRTIAEASRLDIVDYSDSATGKLEKDEDRLYRITEITLRPTVVISDPEKVDRAKRLLDKAEHACLISRSINTTVEVIPEILVAAPVART